MKIDTIHVIQIITLEIHDTSQAIVPLTANSDPDANDFRGSNPPKTPTRVPYSAGPPA